ncbi:hypothetical protein SAMN05216410_0978 [Sanguibacter gelidistatuariae]|uniref:Uncharacterized protein n=1 Tax=Sanguibacter gelidistatuariae TaxID=1814289 RepID=A0A1G6HHH6_9MICO|nr:hypothetical protein [Sanguibacter gelidistatuariae]SDB92886.1 hypothetical protein SAMN05216410_0978 [Sanguibacter gelidistatuariae]
MAFFGLFKGPDPHSWTELWELVDNLSGRVSAQYLGYMRTTAEGMSLETLLRAEEQYGKAMLLLDTEWHAKHLTRDPWVDADQTFGRRRFVRAMHSVIAAGPDAVVTVSADPAALSRYDSGSVPDLVARLVADEPVDLRTRVDGLLLNTVLHDVLTEKGAANQARWRRWSPSACRSDVHPKSMTNWPNVRASNQIAGRASYPFARFDPDASWLHVWTDFTPEGLETQNRTPAEDEWMLHRLEAVARVMEALGPENPPRIGTAPIFDVEVELYGYDPAEGAPEDAEDSDHNLDDGVLAVEYVIDFAVLAATAPEARADLLTQQIARAIMQGKEGLTAEATSALKELAHAAV